MDVGDKRDLHKPVVRIQRENTSKFQKFIELEFYYYYKKIPEASASQGMMKSCDDKT